MEEEEEEEEEGKAVRISETRRRWTWGLRRMW